MLEFTSIANLTFKENVSTAEQLSSYVQEENVSMAEQLSSFVQDSVNNYLPLSGGTMTGMLTVQSPARIFATGPLQCTGLVQFTNRTVATGPLINCVATNLELSEIVMRTNSVAGHSEGLDCIGEGSYCHAEGELTIAGGKNELGGWDKGCHAEGLETSAFGDYSHAEGYRSKTTGGGHAEGVKTYAYGGHAEGSFTSAFGSSHAEGFWTEALSAYSHADGQSSRAKHRGAYTWSGINGTTTTPKTYYESHGEGTFNVNPKPVSGDTDPASGFFIGDTSLKNKLLPLSGETMPANPTSEELIEAVKKIFQKLGGTLI